MYTNSITAAMVSGEGLEPSSTRSLIWRLCHFAYPDKSGGSYMGSWGLGRLPLPRLRRGCVHAVAIG